MDRRTFITATAALGGLYAFPPIATRAGMAAASDPEAGPWRRFKIEVETTPAVASGPLKLWLPIPSQTSYQRVRSVRWSPGDVTDSGYFSDEVYRAPMVYAEWKPGSGIGASRLVYEVETQDRAADLSAAAKARKPAADASLALYKVVLL